MPPLVVIFAAAFGAASAYLLPLLARRFTPATAAVRRTRLTVTGSVVAVLLAVSFGESPLLPVLLPAAALGLLLAVIDLCCLRLPDVLVGFLALTTIVPLALLRPERTGTALVAAVLVLTAYGVIALLPRGGLGLGDVKLAAVLAGILGFAGWPAVLAGVVTPHLINGPIALFLLLTRRVDRRGPLAFGPALLAGALAGLLLTAPLTTA